jgi:predicted nucleic acid-binding Zn ribbon protein
MARPRTRKKPSAKDTIIAEFRGYWETEDLSEYTQAMSNVMAGALKGMGLADRFNEEQVFAAWSTLVSPEMAALARPTALERNVLFIQVLHSPVFWELERMKGQILAKMQAEFGAQHIREVRFRLG